MAKFKKSVEAKYTIPLKQICKDYGIDFDSVINIHCPQKRSFAKGTWKDRTYILIHTEEKEDAKPTEKNRN